MSERPEIRIGDAEREAAVAALGEHYAAGRLTKEEYDERAAIAWSAKFNSVLWPLFADLPRPPAAAPRPVAQTPSRRPPERGYGGWFVIGLVVPAVVLFVALREFQGQSGLILLGLFWLLWVKTYRNAARSTRRRRWDDSHRR